MSESGTVDPSEGALESDFQKRMDESWVRNARNPTNVWWVAETNFVRGKSETVFHAIEEWRRVLVSLPLMLLVETSPSALEPRRPRVTAIPETSKSATLCCCATPLSCPTVFSSRPWNTCAHVVGRRSRMHKMSNSLVCFLARLVL